MIGNTASPVRPAPRPDDRDRTDDRWVSDFRNPLGCLGLVCETAAPPHDELGLMSPDHRREPGAPDPRHWHDEIGM